MKQSIKSQIESLKAQISDMEEMDCFKVADMLRQDLEELEREDPIATIEAGYVARDYSWEAVQQAREKYGVKSQ